MDQLDLWARLMRAQTAVDDAVDRELQDHGVGRTWFEVLASLADAPDGARRMSDLASVASMSPSGLTRLIDRMEEAGLIERTSCPTDRRGVEAKITRNGRETLRCARPLLADAVKRHLTSHLNATETKALWSSTAKILAAHGQDPDTGCRI